MRNPRPVRRLFCLPVTALLVIAGIPWGSTATAAPTGTCSSPFVVPAEGGVFGGTTAGSSALAGSCGSSGSSPEHVYRWTPAASGPAVIRTCGASGTRYDTVLHIRRASCSGSRLACNDDTPGCAVTDGTAGAADHGSRIDLAVTAGETYFVVVDGYGGARGAYTLTIVPPGAQTTLPDLTPQISSISIDLNATVSSGDVAEGCAERVSGVDLLRFTVTSRNIGDAALFLGDPGCPSPCSTHPLEVCANPAFLCSPAQGHNHAHYANYARYELLDGSGQTVVVGHKQGFCVQDSLCANPVFTCGYQGLTPGCSDVYGSGLGCQYLDITDVPAGAYVLRVTLDPFGQISELDDTNNTTSVAVTVPPRGTTSTTLPGSSCGTPSTVPAAGGVFIGTTSGSSQLAGICGGSGSSPEAIFQWTPAISGFATIETCGSGTTYDSVVYLREGSCTGTDIGCNDDANGCPTSSSPSRGSRLTANVRAGTLYTVVVDGYGGQSGNFALRITPPGTTVGCAGATPIPPEGGTITGVTSGTSTVAGSCGSSGSSPERVFAWTPVRSGTATIQTCGAGTTYDSVLYMRQGCSGPEIGCNDDTSGCATSSGSSAGSRLRPSVLASTTYLIVVDGYAGRSGTFTLQVTPPP